MNIGIDISSILSPFRSGVGEYTFEILRALARIDTKNRYFLFSSGFKNEKANIPFFGKNFERVSLRVPNKLFHFFVLVFRRPFFDSLIEKRTGIKKMDIFFSPNIGFVSLSKTCKNFLFVHDLSFEFAPEFFSFKMRLWHFFLSPKKQCERADMIFVPSCHTKKDLVRVYDVFPEKIQVIPHGVSSVFLYGKTSLLEVRKKYGIHGKYILFLGTIEPRKNIISAVLAYAKIKTDHEFIIVGGLGWKYKKIFKLFTKTPGVRYISYVDEKEKRALYEGATFLVFPSLYEGFGLPVIEAMFSGLPVLTSSRSSLPEVTGDAAYFVNPESVSSIENGMRILFQNEKLREILKEKGKERSLGFDYTRAGQALLHYFSSAYENRN